MPKHETVCAVVVTYNRKNILLECLDSLLKQTHALDAIYLIDNASSDGTPDMLKKAGFIKEILSGQSETVEDEHSIRMLSEGTQGKEVTIHYVRMHKNTGGAGGFHEGVKRGYNKGYQWLWLMDDDCLPQINCLELLFKATRLNTYALYGPIVADADTGEYVWVSADLKQKHFHSDTHMVRYVPFNGLLINRWVVHQIGLPLSKMILYGDDVEYGLRAKRMGFNSYISLKSYLTHPRVKTVNIMFSILKCPYLYDEKRGYYRLRNGIYISKHYARELGLGWIRLIFRLIKNSACWIFGRSISHKTIIQAIIDGVRM